MKKIRIQLTPTGHYFFGGERSFSYDKKLTRQMSDTYFISSLKVPGQSTLFGVLRYLIGVKNEKLRENASKIIGEKSFDISNDNNSFGIIKCISPLYLFNNGTVTKGDHGYYIRTPFDHKIAEYITDNDSEKRIVNAVYKPLEIDNEKTAVVSYPGKKITEKKYPVDFKAKDGISHSYMSVSDKRIVDEDKIFVPSVEVVSRKKKLSPNNEDRFAKKDYMRLKKGWSFVFYADLNCDEIPEYNRSVIVGKDSSVFIVDISDAAKADNNEPDVKRLFADRGSDYNYVQSPVYITGNSAGIIDTCSFCIIENENMRRFETVKGKLSPVYGAALIQLISAGSILYSHDIEKLKNTHAEIVGFNTIIHGGNRK